MHEGLAWPLAHLRELGVTGHASQIDEFLHHVRSSWAADEGLLLAVQVAKFWMRAFPF